MKKPLMFVFTIVFLVSATFFSINTVFVSSIESGEMKIITDFNDFRPVDMRLENGLWKYSADIPEGICLYLFSDSGKTMLDPNNPEITEFENQIYSVRNVKDIHKTVLGDGKINSVKFGISRKYVNPVAPGDIYISLEANSEDISDVEIITNSTVLEKEKIAVGDNLIYRFHLKCTAGMLKYKFRIMDGEYVDFGYGKGNDFFEFDFGNPVIGYLNIPEWSRGSIVYQIFPERFKNGDSGNDPDGVLPWNGNENMEYELRELSGGFFGGDLRGIADSLDYLGELNVGCIYMNPVFRAPSTHKYDTADYLEIDPAFGDEKVFEELVEKSHEKNMRIVLDGVFNHSGTDFFAMKQNFIFQEESKYLDWYHILKYPIEESTDSYMNWSGHASLPKFNHDSVKVRGYIASVIGKWFSKGIDGWRLDTADQFTYYFLSNFLFPLIKSISEDSVVVGEYWKNADLYFEKNCMNSVMNYLFRDAAISYAKGGTSKNFENSVNEYLTGYPPQIIDGLWNMLGSHDTERILTVLDGKIDALKTAVALQMTFKGAPVIYYGDEIGMTGNDDPECRKPFIWEENKQNGEIRQFYRLLAEIRSDNTCLKTGSLEFLPSKTSVLIFRRFDENGEVLVVLNSRSREVTLSDDILKIRGKKYTDLLSGTALDSLRKISGRQILILKAE